MRIRLDEKHVLCSDKWSCWIMAQVESKNEKTGKVAKYERRVTGYHPHFEGAMIEYIDSRFQGSEATKVKELAEELKDLKEEVRGWMKGKDAEKLKSI